MPKKPFSGKKKKEQLKAKKQQKLGITNPNPPGQGQEGHDQEGQDGDDQHASSSIVNKGTGNSFGGLEHSKFFDNRVVPTRQNPGRYALTFRTETKEEVLKLKEEARKTIYRVEEEYLECGSEDFYTSHLNFPVRPPWNYELGREELEKNENKYFQEYLKRIDDQFERSELSYFELNIETWRQFWRVLEMSDILLCVLDIRFPPLLFPPSLYEYVRKVGKELILVMNKCDMCPAPLVLAWKDYFTKTYEGLEVICFTSYPSYNLHGTLDADTLKMKKAKKVRGRVRMAAEGAMEVYKVCEKLVQGQVDLGKWKQKIAEEINVREDEDDDTDEQEMKIDNLESLKKQDSGYHEHMRFQEGILTIGCLGQPNVGKSSLINALMGKKVVSVSKTPGHTKHFQTIFLTQNVRLCDCPGLIFPSKVPKSLQVLCGSYPIAQLKEPYSTIQYLAQRLDLPKLLGIQHPEGETEWNAFDIADGWALKRGYYTAKTSRLDSYRGANHVLRLALEGRICLCLRPPGYTKKKDAYSNDPRVAEIEMIQAIAGTKNSQDAELVISESDEDEEGKPKPHVYLPKNKGLSRPQPRESDSENDQEESDEKCDIPTTKIPTKQKTQTQNKFSMLSQLEDDEDSDED